MFRYFIFFLKANHQRANKFVEADYVAEERRLRRCNNDEVQFIRYRAWLSRVVEKQSIGFSRSYLHSNVSSGGRLPGGQNLKNNLSLF